MARILVVDDSFMMRKSIRTILEKAGHTVVADCADGEKAIFAYDIHRPDLVTLDITMPGMNGIAVTKQLMKSYPDAKIIIVSALGQKRMVFDAIESGAKNYILKPITGDNLILVINLVLGISSPLETEDATTA